MRGVRSDRVGRVVGEVGMGPSLGRGRMVWKGMGVVVEEVEVDAATGGKTFYYISVAILQVFYTLFWFFFFLSFFLSVVCNMGWTNGHL